MANWEYRAIYIKWNKEKKDWISSFTDIPPIIGLGNVLNHEGSKGWELVNVIPEDIDGTSHGYASSTAVGYRAIFKRQKS